MGERKPSSFELLCMHIEALLPHDSRSRIEHWNGDDTSPRFFLGRTDKGNLWRFRSDLPDEICEELEDLCHAEPTNISELPRYKDDYMRILSAHAPIERVWSGPDYWFADEIASTIGPIAITEKNAYLLQNELEDWLPDISDRQPFMAMIEEGRAVSVCTSAAISDMVHEASVETLQSHRRKGYGVKVVLAWARAVEETGAMPLYSTSWENLASQNVATRIGLSVYGVNFHVT